MPPGQGRRQSVPPRGSGGRRVAEELLTAAQLRERLDLERAEFDRLGRQRVWPRTKGPKGDRYPWPAALHAFVQERERRARATLPESVTGEQLGELVNRTARTLFNYQKEGIPHQADGKAMRYPLVPAVRWCVEKFLRERGEGEAPGDGKALSVAKQKELEDLMRARAQRVNAELDLAERQGRTVTVSYMAAFCEELFGAVMAVIQNAPGDCGDELVGLTSVAKARAAVRKALDPAVAKLRAALLDVAHRASSVQALPDGEPADGAEDEDDADAS